MGGTSKSTTTQQSETNPWAPEHMRTMPAGLTAITPADVQESARRWLVPDKAWMAKAVAGAANLAAGLAGSWATVAPRPRRPPRPEPKAGRHFPAPPS